MSRSLLFLVQILLGCGFAVFAQDGPGGVGATDGASNLILWLDANRIDSVYDRNNVSTWYDASGNDNNFSQSNANGKPNWYESEVNGYPAVHFDGGERLEAVISGGLSAPLTVVAVAYFDSVNQGTGNNDYVFSAGSQTGANSMTNIARYRDDASNGNKFYNYDGASSNFGPVLNGQQWYIFSQVHRTSATYHSLDIDGASQSVGSAMSSALSTDSVLRVGDWADSPDQTYHLNGSIAEIIVFEGLLTAAEEAILHAYLGAKYSISISGDLYAGDDAGNGHHDHEVIGVGTESDGSQTSALAGGLTLSQSSNFQDGDYVLAGHDNWDNEVNISDVGGGYEARWDRTWWFDITDAGNAATVNVVFDFSEGGLGGAPGSDASDYRLVYRATGSGNWSSTAIASSISGDRVLFNAVPLTLDGYYTLATLDTTDGPLGQFSVSLGCDGPGGVGSTDGTSNLELWLNAEALNGRADDPLVSFYDFSGNANHADQFTPTGIPHIEADAVNGMDAVRFDENDYIEGDLSQNLSANTTVIAVCSFHTDQSNDDNDYVISVGNPTTSGRHLSISRRKTDNASDANKYYSWDGASARLGPLISANDWNVFFQEQHSSSAYHRLYLDGVSSSVSNYSSSFAATTTDYRLGFWLAGGNNGLDGDIAEIIIYDRLLNSAERNIVHSYLGAKFDIAVSGDKYAGDDNGNGNYDRDVAGVGTESDGSNDCASSSGIIVEQNSGFENADYLLFGHRLEINSSMDTDIGHASLTLDERWARVWWMDVTNASTALSVDITFDYSEAGIADVFPGGTASNYILLYRSGTSGNWNTAGTATDVQGDQVIFSGVSLTSDGYYTLATLNAGNSPLPIQLLDFEAVIETGLSLSPVVLVTWATASEVDNDYFTLERSPDLKALEDLTVVKGQGTPHTPANYEWIDREPLEGTSYYRLKQTDLDGSTTYSAWSPVKIDPEGDLGWVIFPNPASETFTIRLFADQDIQGRLTVCNTIGQRQLDQLFPVHDGINHLELSARSLAPGSYWVTWKAQDGTRQLHQRMVIR